MWKVLKKLQVASYMQCKDHAREEAVGDLIVKNTAYDHLGPIQREHKGKLQNIFYIYLIHKETNIRSHFQTPRTPATSIDVIWSRGWSELLKIRPNRILFK